MLLWLQFLWTLEQGVHISGPQYSQVTKWMDYLLCRMPCFLCFQTSISSCTFYYQSRLHCCVISTTQCHSSDEPATGNEGARLPSHLHQTLCLLQGIWGQLGRSGTRKASQATPKDQAHQCLTLSCLQACAQGTYQDTPYQLERPDCWRTHKASGTKMKQLTS